MNAIFRHRGITIDYTPTADVTAGDIVSEGGVNGVANNDIQANTLGALAVVGVFDVEKKTGDAFAFGDTVNWDKVNKQALKTTGSNIVKLGVAVEAAKAEHGGTVDEDDGDAGQRAFAGLLEKDETTPSE